MFLTTFTTDLWHKNQQTHSSIFAQIKSYRNFVYSIIKATHYAFSRLNIINCSIYEGWKFNSGNYLFTNDTK